MDKVSLQYEYEYYAAKMKSGEEMVCEMPEESIGLGEFTIMGWFCFTDLSTKKSLATQENGLDFYVEYDRLRFSFGDTKIEGTEPVIKDIWNHIAVVAYDSYVQLYLNGNPIGGGACPYVSFMDKMITLGKDYFGYMRETYIYLQSLTMEEIVQRMYQEQKNEPKMACCDFTSNPPNMIGLKRVDDVQDCPKMVKLMPVLELGDYAYLRCDEQKSATWFTQRAPFTMQTWIYFNPENEQEYYVILSNYCFLSNKGFEVGLVRKEDGYHISVYLGNMNQPVVEVKDVFETKQWKNIAVVYDGTHVLVYCDGSLQEESQELSREYMEADILLIGARDTFVDEDGEYWFHGYMSRVDVWACALSEQEVLKYIDICPEVPTEGLVASWEFFQDYILNYVTGAVLGRINSARVVEKERDTEENSHEVRREKIYQNEMPTLPNDWIEKARRESGILEFMYTDDFKKGDSLVSSCVYEDKVYFLHHDAECSYPITCIAKDELDPETTWYIELVLIFVEALLSYFLSLKVTYNARLAQYIRDHILSLDKVRKFMALVAAGGAITVNNLFDFIKAILLSGKLKKLISLACDLSFWTIISFAVGFLRRFISGAAEIAIWLSVLLAKVLLHLKKYPRKKAIFQLEEILFCHCEPKKICSIHIRKNDKEEWPLPEWKNGRSENAPAVYRLARFNANADKLEIRATIISTNPTEISKIVQLRVNGGNIFGMSEIINIVCPPGTTTHTVFIAFPQAGALLSERGIDKQELSLSWEYAENISEATDLEFIRFHLSKHQIYTILDSVHAPWGNTETVLQDDRGKNFKTRYPMTDIYDATIDIVRNNRTPDEAKAAITQYFYNSKKYVYNGTSGIVVSRYIWEELFREYILQASIEQKNLVNCEDCAALVGTIANLYGCYLTYIVLGSEFKVKPILLIGEETWRLPDSENGVGYFSYHAIAIDGTYTRNDAATYVYDCCFKYHGNKTGNEMLAIREPLSLGGGNRDSYKQSILNGTGGNSCEVIREGEFYFSADL